jgi:hypothetical protein
MRRLPSEAKRHAGGGIAMFDYEDIITGALADDKESPAPENRRKELLVKAFIAAYLLGLVALAVVCGRG